MRIRGIEFSELAENFFFASSLSDSVASFKGGGKEDSVPIADFTNG